MLFLISCLTVATLLVLMKPEKSFKDILKKLKTSYIGKFIVK